MPPPHVVSRKRTASQANLAEVEERAPKRRQTNNLRPLRPHHIKRFTPPPPKIKERPNFFAHAISSVKNWFGSLYIPVMTHTDREESPSMSDSPIPGAFPHDNYTEIPSSPSEGANSPSASNGAPPTSPSSSPRSSAPSPLSQHSHSQPRSAPSPNNNARPQSSNASPSDLHSYYRTGGTQPRPHNSSPGTDGKFRRAVPMAPAGPQTGPPRRHIHHAQHQRAIRKKLQRELFELKTKQGYSGDYSTFQGYLAYREQVEKLHDLTKPETTRFDSLHHPKTVQDAAPSPDYLQRMLRKAQVSFNEPAPPPNPWRTASASLKFKRKNVALDQSIDSRLHPSQLPSELPPAQDQRVTEALNDYAFAAKGSKRAEVYYGDLQRLRPGQWLNDEVINYYGSLIMQRSGSEPAPGGNKENQEKTKGPVGANEQKPAASTSTSQDVKGKGEAVLSASESEQLSSKGTGLDVYVYSSFFYSKLLESDCYQKGKIFKWTKDVNIFEKDIALLPINKGNAHWTTGAINFQLKRFMYYDSLGVKDPVVYKTLREYVRCLYKELNKGEEFDFTDWEDYFGPDSPQQDNGFDCGVFLCQTMENLSRGVQVPFDFTQRDIPYLRRRMIWEIVNGRLEDR